MSTIVLITGANSGLGYATAQALLLDQQKQYTIIITSRSLERAQGAANKLKSDEAHKASFANGSEVVPLELDQTKDQDIERIKEEIESRYGHLDVLVNNAGINLDGNRLSEKMSVREKFNVTFDTNVSSVHVLTEALIPLLLQSSAPRIVFISSSVASLAIQPQEIWPINQASPAGWPKAPSFTMPIYRTSKAGMNMMILEWRRVLKNDGVVIHLINPGLLATELGGAGAEMMRSFGAADPLVGGKLVKSVIEGERDDDLGKMVELDGTVPW